MHRFLSTVICSLIFTTVLLCADRESAAQNIAFPDSTETVATLIKLSAPIYPPVARQAHITGDVDLMIAVEKDGTVKSAVVVSGPPLLRSVALESAQHAQFECRRCSKEINPYRLVYTFQIEGDCSCQSKEDSAGHSERDQASPRIAEAQHRVTMTAHIICTCDPVSYVRKRRARNVFTFGDAASNKAAA